MPSRFLPCCRRPAATLVETAVVIGACLIFMLAIFEYGRFVMIRQPEEIRQEIRVHLDWMTEVGHRIPKK